MKAVYRKLQGVLKRARKKKFTSGPVEHAYYRGYRSAVEDTLLMAQDKAPKNRNDLWRDPIDVPCYIPMDGCVEGRLYRIHESSKKLQLGVWEGKERGFIGIYRRHNLRTYYGSRFLISEHHWDVGAPHGTAIPFEEVGECDIRRINNVYSDDMYKWLLDRVRFYKDY